MEPAQREEGPQGEGGFISACMIHSIEKKMLYDEENIS